MLGAVVPLIGGEVPPPLIEVLSAEEVKAAMIALIVALAGAGTALMAWLKRKFDSQQQDLKAVKHQTVNSHGPDGKDDNLREQIDRIEKSVSDLAGVVKDQGEEQRTGFRRMDHLFGEVHDRQQATDDRALDEHSRMWTIINWMRDKLDKQG